MGFDAMSLLMNIVGPAMSYAGQQQTNQTNLQAVASTNAANEKMVEETNAANQNLWEEQTAYNTPANQMQRLQDAGLNPNLVYGSGNATSLASTPPKMQAPEYQAGQIQNPVPKFSLSDYQQLQSMNQDYANNLVTNEILKQKAREESANADLAETNASLRERTLDIYEKSDESGYQMDDSDDPKVRAIVKMMGESGIGGPAIGRYLKGIISGPYNDSLGGGN